MSTYAPFNPCVPMKLDAFVLNQAVADDNEAKIAPITQPNYTFLRFSNSVIQNDVLDQTDLHWSSPACNNSRVTDIGKNQPRTNRLGVYLSWTVPRVYRSGTVASAAASRIDGPLKRQKQGYQPTAQPDYSQLDFRLAPTRWLVIRLIDTDTMEPQLNDEIKAEMELMAWVVESDRQYTLDEIVDPKRDLQVDFSPYVTALRTNDLDSLNQQAEVFIGCKTDATTWSESLDANPRINNFSVLNSSNHLFADYQPHNTNVFSMLWDFNYGKDDQGNDLVLSSANASFYVIGWHTNAKEDPFFMSDGLMTLKDRLGNLIMQVQGDDVEPDKQDPNVANWEGTMMPARTVCHGALYNVAWDANNAPPSPAKIAAQNLKKNVPIAVGSTATDTILSYVQVHKGIDSGETGRLEQDIWALGTLLLAQDDGVDAKQQADDMLYTYNFERSDGGGQWHMSNGPDDATSSFVPTDDQKKKLMTLNDTQLTLDNALRTERQLKWLLFSKWWGYVSAEAPTDIATDTTNDMLDLISHIKALRGPVDGSGSDTDVSINYLQNKVSSLSQAIPCKRGLQGSFYMPKDPTLLVAGITSAFPVDFLDKLKIRIDSQVTYQDESKWQKFSGLIDTFVKPLPDGDAGIQRAASALVKEFLSLSGTSPGPSVDPSYVLPLYHDQGPLPTSTGPWRDQWGGAQPWSPLFLEWQADYFHIDFNKWELVQQDSGSKWEYQVSPDPTPLWNQNITDKRTLSGRILILPQPSFSLTTAVDRLIKNNITEVDTILGVKDREDLHKNLATLPFLSSPMSGVTDHLVTLCRGTHIKPSQRPSGEAATAMDAAVSALQDLTLPDGSKFTADQLGYIGQESQKTPYGELVRFSTDPGYSLFKPATHGQMRFTQINVIDKFGQAICALNPDPVPAGDEDHIAPILAELYSPRPYESTSDPADSGQPNVVERKIKDDPDHKKCEFVQLPPGINQDSRLNLTFVVAAESPASPAPENFWRPAGDYDNPIWGWVLINYADVGLQFFKADGTFYREVRMGGLTGEVISSPWKPFGPPTTPSTDVKQLDYLLAQFTADTTGPIFLNQFFRMVELSLGSMPAPPNSYALYLNSIVGRPLALVNFGVSLELAVDALQDQTAASKAKGAPFPLMTLLPPSGLNKDRQTQYSFPIKLGDSDVRPYDGLVGYWNASKDVAGQTDWSSLYTYFNPPSTTSPTQEPGQAPPVQPTTVSISTSDFPNISPFHVSPDRMTSAKPGFQTFSPLPVSTVVTARNSNLSIFTGILDAFSPLHAYSGSLLPMATLTLPHWTVEAAMNKMTAFFRLGPMLVATDAPAQFQNMYEAGNSANLVDLENGGVGIPNIAAAKWAWLQPYSDASAVEGVEGVVTGEEGQAAGATGTGDDNTKYMALGVAKTDERPRYEPGPYTALEGYLQLLQPIMQAEGLPSGPPPPAVFRA